MRRHQFLCFLSWHVRCEPLWRHWSLELTWRENGQRNRPPETHLTHSLNAQRTVTPPDPTPCLPQDASFYLSLTPFKLNWTTESFQWSWNTRRLCERNTLIAPFFLSLSLSFSLCLEYFPQQLSSILYKAVIVERSWCEGASWMSAVESGHSGPLSQHTNTGGWLTLPRDLSLSNHHLFCTSSTDLLEGMCQHLWIHLQIKYRDGIYCTFTKIGFTHR